MDKYILYEITASRLKMLYRCHDSIHQWIDSIDMFVQIVHELFSVYQFDWEPRVSSTCRFESSDLPLVGISSKGDLLLDYTGGDFTDEKKNSNVTFHLMPWMRIVHVNGMFPSFESSALWLDDNWMWALLCQFVFDFPHFVTAACCGSSNRKCV